MSSMQVGKYRVICRAVTKGWEPGIPPTPGYFELDSLTLSRKQKDNRTRRTS